MLVAVIMDQSTPSSPLTPPHPTPLPQDRASAVATFWEKLRSSAPPRLCPQIEQLQERIEREAQHGASGEQVQQQLATMQAAAVWAQRDPAAVSAAKQQPMACVSLPQASGGPVAGPSRGISFSYAPAKSCAEVEAEEVAQAMAAAAGAPTPRSDGPRFVDAAHDKDWELLHSPAVVRALDTGLLGSPSDAVIWDQGVVNDFAGERVDTGRGVWVMPTDEVGGVYITYYIYAAICQIYICSRSRAPSPNICVPADQKNHVQQVHGARGA